MFAEVLHIPPRGIEELTLAEFNALCGYLEQKMENDRKAQADLDAAKGRL